MRLKWCGWYFQSQIRAKSILALQYALAAGHVVEAVLGMEASYYSYEVNTSRTTT